MIPEQRFRGIVQLLQADPKQYKAFGPYWWSVKRMLKEHYGPKALYLLGAQDDRETRIGVESHHGGDEEVWTAAIEHFRESVQTGNIDRVTEIPGGDGAFYSVNDPDAGPANTL